MCVRVFEDKTFSGKEAMDRPMSASYISCMACREEDIRSLFSAAHIGYYTVDDSRELIGETGKLGAIVVALREDGGKGIRPFSLGSALPMEW